jgi:RNA polymerase sigma-70 factor (ECF subfamily)
MSGVIESWSSKISRLIFNKIYNDCWQKFCDMLPKNADGIEITKELVQDVFKSLWERRAISEVNAFCERHLLCPAKLRVFEHLCNKQ